MADAILVTAVSADPRSSLVVPSGMTQKGAWPVVTLRLISERGMPPKKRAGVKRDLTGVRVRVQCSDGAKYEGVVTAWDAAEAEWKILLDDGACGVACVRALPACVRAAGLAAASLPSDGPCSGDELSSPIDEDTWDVVVISEQAEQASDTPETRRAKMPACKPRPKTSAKGKACSATEGEHDECDGSGNDSDFIEAPAPTNKIKSASKSSQKDRKKKTSKDASAAAKRRKLSYDKLGASAKEIDEGSSKEAATVIDSDDDFSMMQPKKDASDDDDDVPLKKGRGKGKGKGKDQAGEDKKRGASGKGKEAVYVCERGCGFEGDFGAVEAHEQVCGYVRGDQWESDMDSDEEEEFLLKWEASVERQLAGKADPPAGLLMPLLPFQRESLAWMCAQEDTKFKGGILADEMGMGKTIQAISLIMANRAKPGSDGVKSTLVVCPLVAMVQWRGEIERYCAAGSLSLTIYHGPKRVADAGELAKYDVVLTTYAIVQSEFSALSRGHKVACPYCNKKYLPPQLKIHHKFFCGPNAQRSAALAKTDKKRAVNGGGGGASAKGQGARGKAVKSAGRKRKKGKTESDESDEDFVPDDESDDDDEADDDDDAPVQAGKRAAAMEESDGESGSNEEEEEEEDEDEESSAKGKGKGKDKGKGSGEGRWAKMRRSRGKINIKEYMADAAVARKEEKDFMEKLVEKGRSKSTLHAVTWHRIVLDEAHTIKDKSCATAKAVFALEAQSRSFPRLVVSLDQSIYLMICVV